MARIYKYFATYTGKHKHLKILGIGIMKPGVEFEVTDQKIWNGLKIDPNFKTRKGYSYKKKK